MNAPRDSQEIKVVVFNVGARSFAIRIDHVKEIQKYQTPVRVPDSPSWLAGVLDIDGHVFPVVSLHQRFHVDESEAQGASHLINLELTRGEMAFTTDEVTAIRTLQSDDIRHLTQVSTEMENPLLEGAVTIGDELVLLIDPERVVDLEVAFRASDALPNE